MATIFISKTDFTIHDDYVKGSFRCDSNLVEPVIQVNKKGFYTYLSYKGSVNKYCSLIPYIMFAKAYEFNIIPKFWRLDYVYKDDRIRAILEADREDLDIVGYDKVLKSLNTWAKEVEFQHMADYTSNSHYKRF